MIPTTSEKVEIIRPISSNELSNNTTSRTSNPPNLVLPERPVITIEANRSFSGFNFSDLWSYRELLYFLIWRDLKVRYKQTFLGVLWVVLQPLLTTVIFTIFFARLARIPSAGVPYPLFAFAGLLPWTFFTSAVSGSGNSLIINAHLITKVYFPRIIIPSAAIGARIVDLAVSFIVLAILMVYYRITPTWGLLALPFLIALITLLSLSIGMFVSALNVKYRDVGVLLPVVLQVWMFASPVLYPSAIVPPNWKRVYSLNPLVSIIEGFRVSLFGGAFDWLPLIITTLFIGALFTLSLYSFKQMEKNFADVI